MANQNKEMYLNADGVKALIEKIGATVGDVLRGNQEIVNKFNELTAKVDAVYEALQWLHADEEETNNDENLKLIKTYKL